MGPPTAEEVRPRSGTIALWRGLTRNVLLLSLVSLLTDVSSEMSLTFLPFFLANVLGAKTAVIGLVEGVADSAASLTRLLSGWLSDVWRARKGLVILGYGLSALTKPFLYFSNSWTTVLGVRFADRVGKGVRSSPRDALLAASAPVESRGFSFGFHRGSDTAGAFLGLLGVALIIYLTEGGVPHLEALTFRRMVLVAIIPALLAVGVLFWVREAAPQCPADPGQPESSAPLPSRFRLFLLAAGLFSLANSSDAFLLLRTQDLGLSVLWIAVLLAGFNLAYSLIAAFSGGYSDRVGRPAVITAGWVVYGVTYLGFALARSTWQVWPLFGLYAIYYGMAEGSARALVADLIPDAQRGTAYGLYNTVVAITALPASLLAGLVWQGLAGWHGWGPSAPFYLGAAFAALALVLFRLSMRGFGRPTPAGAQPTGAT
jgi:MFS family permease